MIIALIVNIQLASHRLLPRKTSLLVFLELGDFDTEPAISTASTRRLTLPA